MAIWQVNEWYSLVKRGPEQRKIALSRPFALIGGHDECDVTINERHAADVAYIAVAYASHIEVWPTCPLAFSMWGRIKRPETELLIGKSRVSLGWESEAGSASLEDWRPGADLIIDWGDGERRRQITRPVSILGNDHPSVIRLHGTALERCDQAVICLGETIWMVDLCASRWENGPNWREMREGDPSVFVNGLHFWCASKTNSEPSKKRLKSRTDQKASRDKLHILMDNSDPEADELTSLWTDQLLETTARRGERLKLLKTIAFSAIAIGALGAVAFIILGGIAPILHSIYGE